MTNKILKIIKKILFSIFLLYGYNMLILPINIMIPINTITVFSICTLGFPALFSFIIIYILFY